LSFSDNPQPESRPPVSIEAMVPMDASLGHPPMNFSPVSAPPVVVKDPVWSGWDVLLMALLTLAVMLVVELFTVLIARAVVYPHVSFGDVAQKPALVILGEFLAYIAVAAYMIMLVQGKYRQPFWQAIRWNWPRNVALMLLLGMLTVSLDLLSRYLPMPKSTPFDQFFARPSDAYLMVAFAVTFGPLMEELFFRGFLYPVLARRTGVFLAVCLTAIPFGMIHYLQYKSWAAVLVITLVGVVLTTVRAVTKSVAASFLVHIGYNGTLMGLAALATDGFRHMEKAAVIRF